MRLTDCTILTFDCYGTLIDWESGIIKALQALFARADPALGRDEVLEAFGRHETAQQTETPSMMYSELLAVVHSRLAREWGIQTNASESKAFGRSVPDWPAFPHFAGGASISEETLKVSNPFQCGPRELPSQ